MEVIAQFFTSLWTALDTPTIPIINVSVKQFLLIILIINIVFGLLNFFLGKHGDSKGDK